MKSLRNWLFLALLALLVIIILFSQKTTKETGKFKVTASFYPVYFFASQIGQDKAEVINLTPAGIEPHEYELTVQDIIRIEKSHLLILNGKVETWADKIKNNLQNKQVTIIEAGANLFTQKLTENGQTLQDPHIWLSPALAKKEVATITAGFIKTDPANTAYYQTNQKKLDDQLDQLDQTYKQGLSNCQQKDIITSHAAFGYLANSYGLNQIPIAGFSPDEEPSPAKLAQVAQFIKDHQIKYVFFEKLLSPKLSQTIATETGAQTLLLDPIEGLTADEIKQGQNYFTLMDNNLKNLQTALQCF